MKSKGGIQIPYHLKGINLDSLQYVMLVMSDNLNQSVVLPRQLYVNIIGVH